MNGDLDILGFSTTKRCPYCDAPLYWSEDTHTYICLNACAVPLGEWRRAQEMMRDITESEGADAPEHTTNTEELR